MPMRIQRTRGNSILKREPNAWNGPKKKCANWSGEEKFANALTKQSAKISRAELMRFKIGLGWLAQSDIGKRRQRSGNYRGLSETESLGIDQKQFVTAKNAWRTKLD